MSMARAAHRRMRANKQVLAHRLEQTRVSRQIMTAKLKAVPRRWFVVSGLAAGLAIGRLPAHTIAAAIGALAAFSLRLLSTPLGPMAIGAVMSRRATKSGSEPNSKSKIQGRDVGR